MRVNFKRDEDTHQQGYKQGLKRAQQIIERVIREDVEDDDDYEYLDENTPGLFRVYLRRVVHSHVDIKAQSAKDAIEKCEIGVAVDQNGNLRARGDYATDVTHHELDGVKDYVDDERTVKLEDEDED